MADRDETEEAVDSLSWPDTSRPIISNRWDLEPAGRDQYVHNAPAPGYHRGGPRRRWPVVLAGVALLAVLVAVLLIWLL